MKRQRRSVCGVLAGLLLPSLIVPPELTMAGFLDGHKGPGDGPITLQQAAAFVDTIDKKLFEAGTIGVKTPDVWGQNRMTSYRAEYETTMSQRVGNFQEILQGAQSRTDLSALTSATSLGATIAAAQTKGRPAATTTPASNSVVVAAPTTTAATPTTTSPTTAAAAAPDPGNPGFADMAAQLKAISDRIDQLKVGTLALPSNVNTFVTNSGVAGVGLEPTLSLDEESRYINHLHELRRVNNGADMTDMAGYGLYLLRMPVSLMPGPESRKGKGAVVTVEARHDLTDDLLENTYRDVAILDLTYVLTQIVNEEIHNQIAANCHGTMGSKPPVVSPIPNPSKKPVNRLGGFDGLKNVAGPNSTLLEDLRAILGPIDRPTPQQLANEKIRDGEIDGTPPPTQGTSPFSPLEAPTQGQPPLPAANPRLSLARKQPFKPAMAAKRDAVIRTTGVITFPSHDEEQRYRSILSNRLALLVAAVGTAQSDPFRHDPSTLTQFQAALLDVHRYMREKANEVDLFQVPKIEALGELLLRRDYRQLVLAREEFLRELYCYRNNIPRETPLPSTWTDEVEPSDVLAFVLLLQYVSIDRQLKLDMKVMAQRRGGNCGDVEGLFFYDFHPTPEARAAFNEYVACKWPLHVYSVDPVVEQQNVLDAFSRRTELQLALAVAVSTGKFNIKNATSFARQLDLDLQTVGLNRTSVGFGAGDTTFGWMFYPRVQTPPSTSNFRTFTNTLTGTGQGLNFDLRNRRIEAGQRECIALLVTPNFIPSLRISTVTNWFDVTGHHAKRQLNNRDMLELSRQLQQAKAAVLQACVSHEYRATDFTVLNQRIKQLEALLPTQDTRVDLPDEGDLLGSEIFSSNAAGLSPSLLAWYGEPVQDGATSAIFLQGRGFNVSETQVIVGGVALQPSQFRLISRNVMQVLVPSTARSVPVTLGHEAATAMAKAQPKTAVAAIKDPRIPQVSAAGGTVDVAVDGNKVHAERDPKLGPEVTVSISDGTIAATAQGSRVDFQVGGIKAHAESGAVETANPCDRAVIDVHIATPNGISNHLFVEVVPKAKTPDPKPLATTATTTTTVLGNTTTTSTRLETTAPGIALPPLTILPMATQLPATTVLAPGVGNTPGSTGPGLITPTPAVTPTTPTFDSITPVTPSPGPVPAPTPVAPTPLPAAAAIAPAGSVVPASFFAPSKGLRRTLNTGAGQADPGSVGTARSEPPFSLPPLPGEPTTRPDPVRKPDGTAPVRDKGAQAETGSVPSRRVGSTLLQRIGLSGR